MKRDIQTREARPSRLALLLAASLLLVLAGCSSLPERTPLPRELVDQATIPDVPGARFWGDEAPPIWLENLDSLSRADLQADHASIFREPHNYLAISGGGANGAFGAGLLAGWTAAGTRPEFTMVTGVSTGALSAPFAFLGAEYDEQLKAVYTTTGTQDIVIQRSLIGMAFSDSMADTAPLRALIEHYVDAGVVEAIAEQHATGRRLYIGTANLDAGRSTIWNIGAIAASDYPRKLALIHDVLQASSAIPVAFPPVVIPVEVDGVMYDEMHVDGGTASQVFVYPASIDWSRITAKLEVPGKARVYVISNAFLNPVHARVKRDLLPIATRSIDSLIRTQGIGDLYQIHALCVRDGNDFNLAYIPSEFDEEPKEAFDQVYMRKLFDLGERMARAGYPWHKTPPGYLLDE